MAFVLDASIALAWAFSDEDSSQALAAAERSFVDQVVVPHHWFLEVTSGLLKAERRRRIDLAGSAGFVERLLTLSLEAEMTETRTMYETILPLARAHRLSTYDAVYLELADRRGLPLATGDGPLADAALRQGVALVGAENR